MSRNLIDLIIFALILLAAVLLAGRGVEAAGVEAEHWSLVQGCLEILGFSPGPTDGIWGPQTSRAAQAYLRTRFGSGWQQVPAETMQRVFWVECLAELDRQEAAPPVTKSW